MINFSLCALLKSYIWSIASLLKFLKFYLCNFFEQELERAFTYWGTPEGDILHPVECMHHLLEQVRRYRVNVDGSVCTVLVTILVLEVIYSYFHIICTYSLLCRYAYQSSRNALIFRSFYLQWWKSSFLHSILILDYANTYKIKCDYSIFTRIVKMKSLFLKSKFSIFSNQMSLRDQSGSIWLLDFKTWSKK